MLPSEPTNAEAAAYLEKVHAASGYVMNVERAWAWRPRSGQEFARLRQLLAQKSGLRPGEMALLTYATAHVGSPVRPLLETRKLAEREGAVLVHWWHEKADDSADLISSSS
jgi:hypothetical protein